MTRDPKHAAGESSGEASGGATPSKLTVVDRRHHARGDDGGAAAAGGAVAAGPRYPTVVEELKARAEVAERMARDAIAGARAELDAVRERLQRDVERRVQEGKAVLLASMLDAVDNLERAARVAGETSSVVAEGIDLIRQQLVSMLRAEGVEPIETVGREYDPNVAEAVVVEPVGPDRDNLVLEEVKRGYRYGDRILRAAQVKVGKAAISSPRSSY